SQPSRDEREPRDENDGLRSCPRFPPIRSCFFWSIRSIVGLSGLIQAPGRCSAQRPVESSSPAQRESCMTSQRVDVGAIRRNEIVEAASAIIAEEGIQNLSLSAIEARTGMKRGQLTYYFRTKEDILLAVFDRMLQMLRERAQASLRGSDGQGYRPDTTGWERIRHLLARFILGPAESRVFGGLEYTFLAQLGHRDDFRSRLANLYEEWRTHMARDLSDEVCRWFGSDRVSPRTLATFIQAVLHGLAMQRAVQPAVYDRQEMLDLLLTMLGPSTRYGENFPSFPQVNHE